MILISLSQEVLCKEAFLKKFAKFVGEHLCLFFNEDLLKKRLWQRCFPVNFGKFLNPSFYRTPPDDCFCDVLNYTKFCCGCNYTLCPKQLHHAWILAPDIRQCTTKKWVMFNKSCFTTNSVVRREVFFFISHRRHKTQKYSVSIVSMFYFYACIKQVTHEKVFVYIHSLWFFWPAVCILL